MKFTNRYNLPDPFVRFEADNQHEIGDSDISVTTLIDSAQIARLKKEHDHEITEDVSDQIIRLLGTAVHNVLESTACGDPYSPHYNPYELVEQRYTVEIDGIKVSGQCDRLEKIGKGGIFGPELGWELQDYKVTSGATLVANPNGKADWDNQVNMYSFLARENGIDVQRAVIWAIIRDWKESSVMRSHSFPKRSMVPVKVDLWPHEDVREYIRRRLGDHGAIVPPLCTKEERWLGDSKFAVMNYVAAGGLSRRAKRVLDSSYEANEYMIENNINGEVVERPGRPVRCENSKWCQVGRWCKQYQDELVDFIG